MSLQGIDLIFCSGFEPHHLQLQVKHCDRSPILVTGDSSGFHGICSIVQVALG